MNEKTEINFFLFRFFRFMFLIGALKEGNYSFHIFFKSLIEKSF